MPEVNAKIAPTPGPYQVGTYEDVHGEISRVRTFVVVTAPSAVTPGSGRTRVVAACGDLNDPALREQSFADAVFLAAAPRLFAACRKAADIIAWLDAEGAYAAEWQDIADLVNEIEPGAVPC